MKISDVVSITINGKNASPYTVSYEREDKICSGKGFFHLVLSLDCYSFFSNSDIQPGTIVLLYENGEVVKRYYINIVSKNLPTNYVEITAQDGSKWLDDYFIYSNYTIENPNSTKSWMIKFLVEVGLSYTFTDTGYGNLLPNDTKLGMMTAYDQMMYLLQLSAWYMYFDSNNTCIIGKLRKDLSNYSAAFDKTDIITIQTHLDDKSLRNRAVVWGKGDSSTGAWVFADISKQTAWNYDANDKRAIVFSSANIPNYGTAYSIAYKFLDEYARLTFTKELTVHGARDISIGDVIFVNSDIFSGTGLVTTVGTEMSSMGLITKIILDERCPRLLGYYGFTDYVYVGLDNNGVWRKHIEDIHVWEDFSTGLTDLCVTDLYKNNGILSCVTSDGSLFRRSDYANSWTKVDISSLPITTSGEEINITEGLKARATTQDRFKNTIYAVVDNRDSDNRRDYGVTLSGLTDMISNYENEYCWVVDVNPYNGLITDSSQILVTGLSASGLDHVAGYDIDNSGYNNYISAFVVGSGGMGYHPVTFSGGQGEFGISDSQLWTEDCVTAVFDLSEEQNVPGTTGIVDNVVAVCSFDNYDDRGIVYADRAGGSTLYLRCLRISLDRASWASITTVNLGNIGIYGIKKLSRDVFRVFGISGGTTLKLYDVDFSDTSYSEIASLAYAAQGGGTRLHTTISVESRSGDYHYGLQVEGNTTNSTLYGIKADYINGTISYTSLLYDGGSTDWQMTCDIALAGTDNFWHNGESGCNIKITMAKGWYHRHWEFSSWRYYVERMDVTLLTVFGENFSIIEETESNASLNYGIGLKVPARDNVVVAVMESTYQSLLKNSYYNRCCGTANIAGTATVVRKDSAYPYAIDESGTNPPFLSAAERSQLETGNELVTYGYCMDGSDHVLVDLTDYSIEIILDVPAGYTLDQVASKLDTVTGSIYVWARRTSDTHYGLLVFDQSGVFIKFIAVSEYGVLGNHGVYLTQNFIIVITNIFMNYMTYKIFYMVNDSDPVVQGGFNFYCILKEEDDNYDLIRSSFYNFFRLDLSDSNPLATVVSGEWEMGFIETFPENSLYLSNNMNTVQVNDFRYASVISGIVSGQKFLYTKGNELYSLDITNLDLIDFSNPVLEYNIEDGILGKLEISNHQPEHQYIFMSTELNGISSFLQSDTTTSGEFMEYIVGLPEDLINIIRVDDRL